MKTKLCILVTLLIAFQMQAGAYVTIKESTSEEYVTNNGYSNQMYEAIQIEHHRTIGKEYHTKSEIQYENTKKPVLKFLKSMYRYFDPAAEDNSFYHHDIKPTPTIDDL